MPLVTIVVVSYNQGKYIRQNLDSIKAQTYPNIELIVADDASPDNSVEVFRNWLLENNISAKEIFHVKNTGLATVLNEAVEMCSGAYVKFIAADDYLHPECLEKSVHCLEEKGKEYGMVATDIFSVDENNHPIPDFADFNSILEVPPSEMHDTLIKGNRFAAPSVLMRTSVVKETGKYQAKFLVEDYQRWLMISEKYFIAYIPEKLTGYRIHPGNISKAKKERIIAEDRMLQMMFDKKGIAKNDVNDYLHGLYVWKKDIPLDFWELYLNYPFHKRVLKFCVQHHIPPVIFKIFVSIALRVRTQFPLFLILFILLLKI